MKLIEMFFVLAMFAGMPALLVLLVLLALGVHIGFAAIIAGGVLGLCLDVCLRGR